MHCTHRHKMSITVLRVMGIKDPRELIRECLKYRMILSNKTSNRRQSIRDRGGGRTGSCRDHPQKKQKTTFSNCFKCGNSRIMHLRNCQAICTNVTEECKRDLSQTQILHQSFMKWIRKHVSKVTKSVGHLLKIQRKRQRKSSKRSCKNSNLFALVIPQAWSCLKQSSAKFLLAPVNKLKVKRVKM